MLNHIAGRVGSKIELVRSLVTNTELKNFYLSLGQLEVDAFEIVVANMTRNIDELVGLLNQQIPAMRTLTKKGFYFSRVALWVHRILSVGDDRTARWIGKNTKILTSEDGIDYLQLSDSAWDKIVFPVLLKKGPRKLPPAELPQVQYPRKLWDMMFSLPPLAKEYVHQQLRLMNETDDSQWLLPLISFDTSSVLFRNMREYLLTVRSHGYVEAAAITLLQEYHGSSSMNVDELVERINSRFDVQNRPAFNLLYTAERLRLFLTYPKMVANVHGKSTIRLTQEGMGTYVLDTLMIPGQPSRISPKDVQIDWDSHERHQAGRLFFTFADTEICQKKFDPDFLLTHSSDNLVVDPLPATGMDKQSLQAALEFLFQADLFGMNESDVVISIQAFLSTKTAPIDFNKVVEYTTLYATFMSLDAVVADELARVNRRRIQLTTTDIIENLRKCGIATQNTPDRIHVFYNLMRETIRSTPFSAPYRVLFSSQGNHLAVIRHDIWRKFFVQPRLAALSS